MEYYIGFDVGTGSARACLVDKSGTLLAEHSAATKTQRSSNDARVFEQSTSDIWSALSTCCKAVLKESGVDPTSVKGIGFDATCSLAVVDRSGNPLSVSRQGGSGSDDDANLGTQGGEFDVILWADHRAESEADLINSTGDPVLSFVGGTMSLEMEVPKTLWLKKHMNSERFEGAQFFDLPDFLTYRATESPARSNCSLACKYSYVPPGTKLSDGTTSTGWSKGFFDRIGLGSVAERDFEQVGGIPGKNGLVLSAGQPVGRGLSAQAASDLGLKEGTAVGSAVIDAYAGWIGTVAATPEGGSKPTIDQAAHRLAAVAGTSTCHLVQSRDGIDVPGVWGPYRNAVFPGLWMNEGGQSSTGQLIEFVISTHPANAQLEAEAKKEGKNKYELLAERLEGMRQRAGAPTLTHLTKDLHVYPDLHGNRSPLADPKMRGMITGLALDDSLDDLAAKYHVTMEAIALQTRHVVETLNSCGHAVDAVYMSGSQAKNLDLMRLLATVLQMPVAIPPNPGAAVVLGSAMLGRFAYDAAQADGCSKGGIQSQAEADAIAESHGARLWDIMVQMTKPATIVEPRSDEFGAREKKLLDAKYKVFREAIDVQRRWRKMVAEAAE